MEWHRIRGPRNGGLVFDELSTIEKWGLCPFFGEGRPDHRGFWLVTLGTIGTVGIGVEGDFTELLVFDGSEESPNLHCPPLPSPYKSFWEPSVCTAVYVLGFGSNRAVF